MKQASEQYRKEMMEPWRGQWLLNLYIGLVRERFQSSAVAEALTPLSFLSNQYNPYLFRDRKTDNTIATFEKNMFKADGSSFFTNEKHDGLEIAYYGLVSGPVADDEGNIDCQIRFYSNVSETGLRGLSLHFDKTYPTQFTIVCNDSSGEAFRKQYTNDSETFVTTDIFGDDVSEMVLKIEKMNMPNVRFRMRYVLFGVGVSFGNDKIMSTGGSLKCFMHPCSVELPTQDLDITIDNYDNSFDFDNTESLINLVSIGEDTTIQIGYTKEDGTVEQIPGTFLELSDFSVDGSSFKINAVDFLRNENSPVVFDDPSFFSESTTLYDVAEKVLSTLVNENFTVVIDDSLKTVPMKFNHIETTTKEALMMIASAGRCVMDLKDKALYIRHRERSHAFITVSADKKAPYSDMDILTSEEVTPFATFELNRQKADGSYLIPNNGLSYVYKTGYISSQISNANGVFSDKPKITIQTIEAISPGYFSIVFNSVSPKKITIRTYYENEIRETLEYTMNQGELFFETLMDFESFNRMDVEISEVYSPYSRVYMTYIAFDENVYDMPAAVYENQKPQGSVLELTRNILVNYTTSTRDENGNFDEVVNTVMIPCNTKGADLEYDNPFITTKEVAQKVGEWLKSYYSVRIQYDVAYMGDPTIEPYDAIKLENDHNDNLICDAEDVEISFSNGGIRGKITARRREDELVRTKNKLAVR